MKSEYRCLVESILSDEQKMVEITKIHAESLERFQKAAEMLVTVSGRLEARRADLARLDALLDKARPASGGGSAAKTQDPSDLQGEIREINASLKFLCREVMRPEA